MLATEERVEIIILCHRKGYSKKNVAAGFNRWQPNRQSPSIT